MKPTDVAPGCPSITQAFGCTNYALEWYKPDCLPIQRYHDGVDLAGSNCCGTPILAVADGEVIAIGETWPGSDGLGPGSMLVRNIDNVYAGYGHGYNEVQVGTKVKKGQRIGRIGTQGNSSGCHLHLLLGTQYGRVPLGTIDPLSYVGPSQGDWLNMLSDAEQRILYDNVQSIANWIAGTGNATFYLAKSLDPNQPGGVAAWQAGTGNATYYNTQSLVDSQDKKGA